MKLYQVTNKFIFAAAICLLAATSCSVEPEFHTQTVPETFYTSQDAVWQRFNRSFTHWRWWMGGDGPVTRFRLQELGTDELCLPTRGSDWYDGAVYQKWHHHQYAEDMSTIYEGWRLPTMGVALAFDAMEDLAKIDYDALGFPAGTMESMVNQQRTLAASLYLDALDLFGGMPLYTTTQSEIKARSTDQETFTFIEDMLKEAIPSLPVKEELGGFENGTIKRAAAATLLARLYFNAGAYIGKDMYSEAAAICQDIIDGIYGKYDLDTDWTNVFGFTNDDSPEIIWSVPSHRAQTETYGTPSDMVPYNYRNYLGNLEGFGSNNSYGLLPSLDPYGNKYPYKLGGAYGKFHDKDVRKQPYVYEGDGKYRGMFIIGELINPTNPEWVCVGNREYRGSVITVVDQVAHYAKVGKTINEKTYPDLASVLVDFPSTIGNAEENSLVRLMKVSPRPNQSDLTLRGNPDLPVIRLAEIYYTLAECKMRAGDKAGAATLINQVRARYFTEGDPDPVTEANLDKYRMLDEWMIEFIGECRRRTDLIRWDAYVTEEWWDKPASNNRNLHRYPIHYNTRNANQLLEQNPGYE